jgi:hypothetical protein
MNHRPNLPKVLIPFNLAEAVTVREAAKLARRAGDVLGQRSRRAPCVSLR